MPTIAGAVLAAGAGRRMGTPKGELIVAGERLVDRAVRVLREAGCEPVIAVVREATAVPDARAVINPQPERGMRSSLDLAVGTAADVDALAVLLVDMPGVSAADVRAVVAAWRPGRIAIARYRDRGGHPTIMAPAHWRAALAAAGPDEGARAFVAAHPHLVDEVPVGGDPTDLDLPAQLRAWRDR